MFTDRRPSAFAALVTTGLAALACVTAGAQSKTTSIGLVLTGVTVIDTHTGKASPDMNVAIADGKIVKIGRAGTFKPQREAQIVDARGKFLIPGFWDMHAHPLDGDRAQNLAIMLAYGITGVRQMSGSDATLAQRKAGTLYPSIDSPEIVAMPGTLLTRAAAATPEAATALVQHDKALGADFFKTVDATPPVFFAALAEADKESFPFAGHLSPGVDPAKASEQGMRAIEHLGPGETILNPCSTDAAGLEAAALAHPPATPQNLPPQALQQMAKLATASPMLARMLANPGYFDRLQHTLDTQADPPCLALAKIFIAHGTWQAPTLIRLRTMQMSDDPQYTADPNLKYVSPATLKDWNAAARMYTSKATAANKQTIEQLNAAQLHMTKLFDTAGVRMLAGSDFGGIWVIPGVSLHQEFDLLGQAGLSPLRVLQMTTLYGAEFFHRTAIDGTVAEGENANLVLLDGNPVESVANLHKVAGVLRDGRYYDKAALEALKTKAAAELARPPASGADPKATAQVREPFVDDGD